MAILVRDKIGAKPLTPEQVLAVVAASRVNEASLWPTREKDDLLEIPGWRWYKTYQTFEGGDFPNPYRKYTGTELHRVDRNTNQEVDHLYYDNMVDFVKTHGTPYSRLINKVKNVVIQNYIVPDQDSEAEVEYSEGLDKMGNAVMEVLKDGVS